MRKVIFMLVIAAMAFASCSKDIVKETNKGRAIDFRVATQVRATETSSANLSTFYVTALNEYGENYYTDAAYTKVNEYFSSSPAYYWPGDGSSLDFYAYAPSASTLGATVTIDSDTKKLCNFSPASQINKQEDFITATATGSSKDADDGLALVFNHQLAQVEVNAKNANEGYIYYIKGVRITLPVSKGDFDFSTSEWTLDTDSKATYEVTYNSPITLSSYSQNIMEAKGENAMLLPQQLVEWNPDADPTNTQKGAYISVYTQITSSAGAPIHPAIAGEYAWVAVPIDTEWKAGNKYVYTLDFTDGAGYTDPVDGPAQLVLGKKINFNVNVTPWEDKNMVDPIVGVWHIKKVHVNVYSKETGETLDDIQDNVAYIEEHLNPTYIEYEFISSTEVYFTDEYGKSIATLTPKDGKLYATDVPDLQIYFEWADESKTTLKFVMLSEDENYINKYYLYYEKR